MRTHLNIFYHYHQTKPTLFSLNPAIFPPIFKSLAATQSLNQALSVHADVIKLGLTPHTSTCNSLITLYCKCGILSSALNLFDVMPHRDSVSYNAVLHGLLTAHRYELALSLFSQARTVSCKPNISSLVLVLQACRRLGRVDEGLKAHTCATKIGFCGEVSVQNALISLYVRFGELGCARKVFDGMCDRDVISWSSLISGYAQFGKATEAMRLFRCMCVEDGVRPDGLAAVSVLQACTGSGDIDNGKSIHGHVIRGGFEGDVFVGNSLIDMYSKCLDAVSAVSVFNQMLSTNLVSWNSIMHGLVHNEKYFEALRLFDSMQRDGIEGDEITMVNLVHACKRLELALCCRCIHAVVIRRQLSNDLVQSSLVDAYTKSGLMKKALIMFDRMERRDVISWRTVIAGFANSGNPGESIALFIRMLLANETPNAATVLSLLEACSTSAELKLSKSAHGLVIRNCLMHELAIGTSLVDMYGKCGDPASSRKVFDEMPAKNVQSWNAMIGALGMNGCAKEALSLLHDMKLRNLNPNGVTMLSILSACSHGGLIQDGLSCFQKMLDNSSLQPSLEHYSCVVDMLGRAGAVEGAVEVIEGMPEGMEAGAAAWGALLSACRTYGKLELGQRATARVIELEPGNSAGYLMGYDVFARRGLGEEMARMRGLMRERRLKMVGGYSSVHVEQMTHRFVAWDENHKESDEIYCMVEHLHDCMKKIGRERES